MLDRERAREAGGDAAERHAVLRAPRPGKGRLHLAEIELDHLGIVGRRDEFGAMESGFNRMTDELTALVGQAQHSAVQMATSVTEIAATAKQQQATATETAATTSEIGATSRQILATSRGLVRTMSEVSLVSEQTASLAGTSQESLTSMEETMLHVTDAAGSVNNKLAILTK